MSGQTTRRVHARRRTRILGLAAAVALGGAVLAQAGPGWADPSNPPPGYTVHHGPDGTTDENVCSDAVAPGQARCFARVRTDSMARNERPMPAGHGQAPAASVGNNGAYDPSWLESAYNDPWFVSAPTMAGTGETVAVVDAYDDPGAASDLAYYRSFFGLPACGAGCFTKVNENGGTTYPAANSGWAQETSLDLDMVSALCPNCHILLVEASSSYISDLGKAVNTAVAMGANAVSNSYGSSEYASEDSDSTTYYDHPGVAVVVASGDNGYGSEFPAASPDVTAVGGTTLNQATDTGSRNGTETVWSGAGSGCSALESKPSWQADAGCADRTVADTAAVGDPSTGVWVYDTYGSGWYIFGGTSVATPIVSSFYALAQNPTGASTTPASYLYAHPSGLNKVTSGSNGSCGSYLCNAADSLSGDFGFNGPTGLGTPNGVAAFTAGPVTPTLPGAPTGLKATAGNAQVALSWSAPASTGNDGPLTYDLYRSTTSGGEGTTPVVTGIGSTSYTDTTLTNGQTYYYEVAAVNALGTGSASSEASATPSVPVTVPGAPQSLRASTDATKGVDLTWNAPAGPVSSYVVYRGTRSGRESAYVTVSSSSVCNASGACSYRDTGTRSGTTYYYQVAATDTAGTGPKSSQVSARAR